MQWQPPGPGYPGHLRPLSVGEIIDASFKLYRDHFLTLIRVAAITVIPIQILAILINLSARPETKDFQTFDGETRTVITDTGGLWRTLAALLVLVLLQFVAGLVSQAAITRCVADRYLFNATPNAKASLQVAFRLIGPLLLMAILYLLGVLGGMIACIIPGIYLAVAWNVSGSALVVENVRGAQALRRSMELVRGRWWPALGLQLLMGIITSIASLFITIPLSFIGSGGSFFSNGTTSSEILWNGLGQLITGVILTPLTAVAIVLFYFDLRVRKEGLDVALLATALDAPPPPAPPSGTPPVGPYPAPPLGTSTPPPGAWGTPPPPGPPPGPPSTPLPPGFGTQPGPDPEPPPPPPPPPPQ